MKSIFWADSTRSDLRAFPKDARRRAGHELHQVQRGLDPSDWKPLPAVGTGVREIRVHTGLEHRVVYIAKLGEGIYALHAFEKKTRRTSRSDLGLARKRLAEIRRQRTPRVGTKEK